MKGQLLRSAVLMVLIILVSEVFALNADVKVDTTTKKKQKNKQSKTQKTGLKEYMTKEEFMKKYTHLEEYYARWKTYVPERDYPEDPMIDHYLKLEKEGKLDKKYTIYHNDNETIADYLYSLEMQPKSLKSIFDEIKKYHPYVLSGEYEDFWWTTIAKFTNTFSIPKIDYFLWKLKILGKENVSYQDPEELCLLGDFMIRIKAAFPKEVHYYKTHVLPLFRGMVLSGSFNPKILKILYLFEDKDILPIAVKIAEKTPIHFTMWGKEHVSLKKKIRIVYVDTKLKPYVLSLLNSKTTVNYSTQYDCVLWLEWAGELEKHFDIIFKILDKRKVGYPYIPDKYIEFLWEYKNIRIKKYFEKNLNNSFFKNQKDKMKKYIEEFE